MISLSESFFRQENCLTQSETIFHQTKTFSPGEVKKFSKEMPRLTKMSFDKIRSELIISLFKKLSLENYMIHSIDSIEYRPLHFLNFIDPILVNQVIRLICPRINCKYFLGIRTFFPESLGPIGLERDEFKVFCIHVRMPRYDFCDMVKIKIMKDSLKIHIDGWVKNA